MKKSKALIFSALFLLLAILFSLAVGRYEADLPTLFQALLAPFTQEGRLTGPSLVLWTVRLPRVLMSVLVGVALSVAGTVFQGVFRNPLVSPGILGVSSGASFGAALAIFLGGNTAILVESSAFLWGLCAVFFAYQLGRRAGNSVTSLVLAGVIISALFTAALSFLKYRADPYMQLPAIVFWTMGSFNNVVWQDAAKGAIMILSGVGGLHALRWCLNPLALGDEDAMALGVDVHRARLLYILVATLIVAGSISACGNIGWVGLVVPHMARLLVGADHHILIPFSALLGGIFLLLMDTLARTMPGGEIPVGILTAFLGAPFFAYLLIKAQRVSWNG